MHAGRNLINRKNCLHAITTTAAFTFFNFVTGLSYVSMYSTTTVTANLEICQFRCLQDNYGYLIHDPKTGYTAAIDTPDAVQYERMLDERGWRLTHIFNTHHHWE